jgi:hypothetical protein
MHYTPNQKFGKQEYFCAQGLTAIRGRRPTGKSVGALRTLQKVVMTGLDLA